MFKLLLLFSVRADSGQRIHSSTPRPSKCVFFQVSLKFCGFFMFLSGFSRTWNSFSRSPTFNKHVRFTLFASSGSHRHTSLQNPLPEAMAIILLCIHFLPIIISPSHPCHSQLPRPWPRFSTASTAAPAASSRWTTLSWPFWAARSSDVQPRSARRGGWRWRSSSKLHGEVVFPIRNDAKAMEKSLFARPQVWTRLGNLLLHHIHISRLGIWVALHTFIHALAQRLGLKLGQTFLHDSEWKSKIHLWYQIETGNIHKKNWQAKKTRKKGCEEGGLKRCPFSIKFRHISKSLGLFPNSKLYTLNLVYWSRFLFNIKMHSPSVDTATTTHHSF